MNELFTQNDDVWASSKHIKEKWHIHDKNNGENDELLVRMNDLRLILYVFVCLSAAWIVSGVVFPCGFCSLHLVMQNILNAFCLGGEQRVSF